MATKKDLVEAYSFSRRRLVTAFVSGAPGGREVEPARPGRMIVGGVALAVLLIAGAAIAGALSGRAPEDWNSPGNLVTDNHGALYVVLTDEQSQGQAKLRPVINVTSARLILGSKVQTKSIPDDDLASADKGPSIGILDAPPTVPGPDRLLNSGWVSCTAAGKGVQTEVTPSAAVEPAPDSAFVVRAQKSGVRYVIAQATAPGHRNRAYRYRAPEDADALYSDLHLEAADEIVVPDAWLALFPVGGTLDQDGLGLDGWGEAANLAGYSTARVGDYYERSGQVYAVSRDGFVLLDEFAFAVLRNTRLGKGYPRLIEENSESAPFDNVGSTYDDAAWPQAPVSGGSMPSTATVCGVLDTAEGEEPGVTLATFPSGPTMLGDIAPADADVRVEPGYGAVVHSADWNTSSGGTVHLVDDAGRSYSIAGDLEVENLGYGGVPAVVVPESWLQLFRPGPDLSQLDALCPPRPTTSAAEAPTGPSCA